ncbi:Lrp/AsnC family transcriptional regulator, partial [Acinetobacter baumannii]|uniref:Lrp/AsnC family transcriptional regulator n=1 Tax=Acinetobacter baumannii TaxID=470 RepID=UPI0018E0C28C
MTSSADKKHQDSAHVVPGAPNSITPQVKEPTTPTEPAPPKPDQKGPTPHTAAGKKLPVESEDLAQQGEYLTTAQGARLPNTELADEIGLTPAPTLRRVRRLEEEGIIQRYVALLDHKKVGR